MWEGQEVSSTVEGCSVMYTPDSCTNFNNTTDHKMYDVSGFSEKTDWVRVFRGRPDRAHGDSGV